MECVKKIVVNINLVVPSSGDVTKLSEVSNFNRHYDQLLKICNT